MHKHMLYIYTHHIGLYTFNYVTMYVIRHGWYPTGTLLPWVRLGRLRVHRLDNHSKVGCVFNRLSRKYHGILQGFMIFLLILLLIFLMIMGRWACR
jgi:hypothetical protein